MSDDYSVRWVVSGIECEVSAPSATEAVSMYREMMEDEKRTNATIHEPYGARSGGITDD